MTAEKSNNLFFYLTLVIIFIVTGGGFLFYQHLYEEAQKVKVEQEKIRQTKALYEKIDAIEGSDDKPTPEQLKNMSIELEVLIQTHPQADEKLRLFADKFAQLSVEMSVALKKYEVSWSNMANLGKMFLQGFKTNGDSLFSIQGEVDEYQEKVRQLEVEEKVLKIHLCKNYQLACKKTEKEKESQAETESKDN